MAAQLTAYLKPDPTALLAELIQEALQVRLVPKDGAKLLALAGIVIDAPRGEAEHVEDFEGGCV